MNDKDNQTMQDAGKKKVRSAEELDAMLAKILAAWDASHTNLTPERILAIWSSDDTPNDN